MMRVLANYRRELAVAGTYLALLLLLAVLTPTFYRAQFRATWVSAAPVLVVAVGMTLVILARHIDISVGAQFSLCGVIAGLLARGGMPMGGVVAITLLVGAALGAVNGSLVAALGLPSIVVTLATMVILRESLRLWREGDAVRGLPSDFQWFGASQEAGQWTIVLSALLVFALFACAMRWLAAGRNVYAVGSDEQAARLAGVRPQRVVFWVFVLTGALTGLAAILNAVRFANVDPNAGNGLELQVIAAVVVGGVAITGGRGTLFGTLIGVALLGTIGAALVFLKTRSEWERAIQGAIILISAAASAASLAKRRSR
ncbi:MAG TPA: ABC transporter permease [Tepidisphaeraceae bacterium]|nr:ABC transporter permease [Tepidisphaeraceae bacterium]